MSMQTRRTFTASALLTVLMGAGGAAAAHKRRAFVVGNNEYENIDSLRTAANDADAVGRCLEKLGFEATVRKDLSRKAFVRAFADFEGRLEPGDAVVMFYAGHGVEISGANYLLPTDAPKVRAGNAALLRDESVMTDDLIQRIKATGATISIVVLDACRSNPFRDSNGRSVPGTRGFRTSESSEGVFIMYAAGNNEVALDRLSDNDAHPNSVFTRAFLPLLENPEKSLVDVAKDTRVLVKELAARVGHKQSPAYYDDVDGDLYVARAGNMLTVRRPMHLADATNVANVDLGSRPGGQFVFHDSHQRKLGRGEVARLPAAERRIAWNEIYARRGRLFRSAALRSYFGRCKWYKPKAWDVGLSELELANVSLIQEVEASARET